jgi:hypothetical protein
MSKEAVVEFLKKAVTDSSLQKELVEFAAQRGFDFTTDELADADLDSVAGGVLPHRVKESADLKKF